MAGLDVTSITIQVKSDGVEQAANSLNKLADAADKVESSTGNLTATSKKVNDSYAEGRVASDKLLVNYQKQVDLLGATTSQINAYNVAQKSGSVVQQQLAMSLGAQVDAYKRLATDQAEAIRMNKAMDQSAKDLKVSGEAFLKSLQDQAGAAGLSGKALRDYNAELLRTKAAQLGVGDSANVFIQKLQDTEKASAHAGGGLSGITRELIVLGHEASQGQFSRFGGSMIVLGERMDVGGKLARSMAAGIEAANGSIVAFLAPIAIAIALIGTLAAGFMTWLHSTQALHDFNKELILTGNYAGTTGDALYDMSAKTGELYGNLGKAREATSALAATGKFTADQIGLITNAAVGLYTYGGVSIDATIEQFEKLAAEPLGNTERSFHAVSKAAMDLDTTLHFLNPTMLEEILIQENLGKTHEASQIAIKSLATTEAERVEQLKANMTTLGKLAHDAAAAFTNMWNSLWTKQSSSQQLEAVKKQLAELNDPESLQSRLGVGTDTKKLELQKEFFRLTAELRNADQKGQADAAKIEANRQAELGLVWFNSLANKTKGVTLLQQKLKENDEFEQSLAKTNANSIFLTEKSKEERRLEIAKEFGEKVKKVRAEGSSGIDAELKQIQASSEWQKDDLASQVKALDEAYKAKKISVFDYVDQKNAKLQEEKKVSTDTYTAEVEALLLWSNEFKRTTSERNIASGKIQDLSKQYIKQLASENDAITANGNLVTDIASKTADTQAQTSTKIIESIKTNVDAVQAKIDAYNRLPEAIRSAGVTEKQLQDGITQSYIENMQAEIEQTVKNNDIEDPLIKARLALLRQEILLKEQLKSGQVVQEQQQQTNTFNLGFGARAKEEAAMAVQAFNEAGKTISDGFTAMFGNSGKPMGEFFKAFTDGLAKQTAAQERYNKVAEAYKFAPEAVKNQKLKEADIKLTQEQSQANLGMFAETAQAAAGFFDSQSKGYAVMNAISKAAYLAETAMAIASIAPKIAAGAATMFAQSGWGGFAGVAAMVAVMAAFGFSGGGSGGAVDTSSAAYRQKTQGTGSVLGDASAQSDSINKSLEIIAKDSGLGLVHFQSMDNSLKAVVAGLSSLGSSIVQFGGINDLTKNIAANKSGGWLGSVVNSIFGGNTSVKDAGITFGSSTVGGVAANGINGQSYNDVHKSGGWFSSGSDSTQLTSLGAATNKQISDIINNLAGTISAAATQLGVGGSAFEDHLESFVVDIGKISLQGLSGDDVTKALNAVFSKLGDDMAAFAVDGLAPFQKIGEGYLETLSRVANDLIQVQDVFAVLGRTLNLTGIDAVKASEGLISVFGSIDKLTSATQYFVDNFLTDSEKLVPIQASLNAELTRLHLSTNLSVDDFKKLVMSQDLTTATGQEMYAALMNLAPAFKQVTDAAKDASDAAVKAAQDIKDAAIAAATNQAQNDFNSLSAAITKSKNEAQAAYDAQAASLNAQTAILNAQVSSLTTVRSGITALSTALDGALKTMTDNTVFAMTRAQAQATLNDTLEAARKTGKLPTADDLKGVLETLGKDPAASFSSYSDYVKDVGITAGKVSNLNDITKAQGKTIDTQLSVAQKQLEINKQLLDAAKATLDAENAKFDTLLGFAQQQLNAMNGTTVAITSLTSAFAAFNTSVLAAINSQKGNTGSNGNPIASTKATQDDVVKLYETLLGREPADFEVAHYISKGLSASDLAPFFLGSAEYATLHPNGSHANGLDSVPFDGYTAKLHKGEMVLPAKQAKGVAQGSDMAAVVAAIENSCKETLGVQEVMQSDIRKLYKRIVDMSPNGQSLQTTAGPT